MIYSFAYLATPYRAFPGGLDQAAEAAERVAAKLLDAGVEVYSPVAHHHRLSKLVRIADPGDDFWLVRQKPFLRTASGIIVATLPGWDQSSGVRFERIWMEAAGKPEWLLSADFTDLPEDMRL